MNAIAAAQPSDVDAIADLLDELGRHYGAQSNETHAQSAANTAAALFGNPPSAHALLAWDGDDLTGMAAYVIQWPARGTARLLFLKELFVRDSHRVQGIGGALMDALFAEARRLGIGRVEWQADAGNVAAQRFYERLGAKTRPKVSYRYELG